MSAIQWSGQSQWDISDCYCSCYKKYCIVRYYSGQACANEYSAPFVYLMEMLKVTDLK